MTINYKGQQVEALPLIMQKKNALEIISGKKKIEIRSYNDFYYSRFMDTEAVKFNQKNELTPDDEGFKDELKAIEFIRFHDYKNSWFLDCATCEVGYIVVDSQDVSPIAEEYDFHDLDEDAKANDTLPDEEKPMVFFLAIDEVIDTSLK